MRVFRVHKIAAITVISIIAISAYIAYRGIPCYMAERKRISNVLNQQEMSIKLVVSNIRNFEITDMARLDAGGLTVDLHSGDIVINEPFPYGRFVYKDLVKSRYQTRSWMNAIPGKRNNKHYILTAAYLRQLRKRLNRAMELVKTSQPPDDWTQKCNTRMVVDLDYYDVQQITPPIEISDGKCKLAFIFQEDRNDIKPPLIHTRWMKPWPELPDGLLNAYAQMGEISLDMFILSGHLTYKPEDAIAAGIVDQL